MGEKDYKSGQGFGVKRFQIKVDIINQGKRAYKPGQGLQIGAEHNAALAIISAIRSSSREKLYQELSLESLRQKRWCRKL